MEAHSYISNFRKKLFLTIFIIFLIFSLDKVFYETCFTYYDKMHNLVAGFKKHDGIIVGSSHILWDIDKDLLLSESKLDFGLLNVPGADLEIRIHFIEEYLRRHKSNPPKFIFLETDKYVFHPLRYQKDSAKSIYGYYHKGYIKELLERKMREDGFAPYLASMLFKSYTLNHHFHFIASKLYDKSFSKLYRIGFILLFGNHLFAEEVTNKKLKKMTEWKKHYEHLDNSIDQKQLQLLKDFISRMENFPSKIILLETPNYELTPEINFENVRSELKGLQKSNVFYVRISPVKIEENIDLFFDASHLNLEGRFSYTLEISKLLNSLN